MPEFDLSFLNHFPFHENSIDDVKNSVGELDDSSPFLLFPIRIETRFKTVHGESEDEFKYQLWVRVFPDECLIQHESLYSKEGLKIISKSEVLQIKDYWSAMHAAQGDVEKEQGIWRAFAGNVEVGRALWLLKYYKPAEVVSSDGNRSFVWPVDDFDVVDSSRNSPAQVILLPDYFTLHVYPKWPVINQEETIIVAGNSIPKPLVVGPDPSSKEDLFKQEETLQVSDDIKWMFDFDRAVNIGMGFKIDLTKDQYDKGFDRLIVVGVDTQSTEEQGKKKLEAHFDNRHHASSDFALISQGSPTNNIEKEKSGYSFWSDPDDFFDLSKDTPLFEDVVDWSTKKDGQWLAELLGISSDILNQVPNSDGTDQMEAEAMNTALWPATWGYFLESMLHPIFDEEAINNTRWFANHFVSGRGMLPAIRFDNQPYGILPVTAFSRLKLSTVDSFPIYKGESPVSEEYLEKLFTIISTLDDTWSELVAQIPKLTDSDDPYQGLMDVLSLHSGSEEFHQRFSLSMSEVFMRLLFLGRYLEEDTDFDAFVETGRETLAKLGYPVHAGQNIPDILSHYMDLDHNLLNEELLIDDLKLSETDSIRGYTPDGDNYLKWLVNAVKNFDENKTHGHIFDRIRLEEGFNDDTPPSSLLYLLLRHSILLSIWSSCLRISPRTGNISQEEIPNHIKEHPFIFSQEHSKWDIPYNLVKQDWFINDFNDSENEGLDTSYLHKILNALELLEQTPTSKLERAFTEHIDCASYRLDAWKQGLIQYQLASMRYTTTDELQQGIYTGAFGWLEDVRPKNSNPLPLDESTSDIEQPQSSGFIHTPSLNQAVTGAVLRSGYDNNLKSKDHEQLGIKLTSDRVRKALSIIEGVRNGQGLPELLGYRFERSLHDHKVELNKFISVFRKAFPLYENKLKSTKVEVIDDIETIEVNNVVDGLALVRHIKKEEMFPYAISFPSELLVSQRDALVTVIDDLLDVYDALGDISLSEGVYHAVQGNYDRAAATLDAFSRGSLPPEIEYIKTPRSGRILTHRVAIHLNPDNSLSNQSPRAQIESTLNKSPRAQIEPTLNKWLDDILPDLEHVSCAIEYFDFTALSLKSISLSLSDLDLAPIDLLALFKIDDEKSVSMLEDRILFYCFKNYPMRPDSSIKVLYAKTLNTEHLSFSELNPLIRNLRLLLHNSRSLLPKDLAIQANISDFDKLAPSVNSADTDKVLGFLQSMKIDVRITSNIESEEDLSSFLAVLDELNLFNLSSGSYGYIFHRKREIYSNITAKLEEVIVRWEKKLVDADALFKTILIQPENADEEDFVILRKINRLVSVDPVIPQPADTSSFNEIIKNKKELFKSVLAQLKLLHSEHHTTATELLDGIEMSNIAFGSFDLVTPDFSNEEKQLVLLIEDTNSQRVSLIKQLGSFPEKVTSEESNEKVIKSIFGQDFIILPSFSFPPTLNLENAKDQKSELLTYLKTDLNISFPVDEWLYGIARVRPNMHIWENITMLTEAFNSSSLELHPVQLPYRDDDSSWLAMEFPEDTKLDSERLLYTSHYGEGFHANGEFCGLLIDEWTEMIPAEEETTGLAYNYDAPSSEPPQTLLMCVPPVIDGKWEWADIVESVNEALDMAKKRAVEPDHISQTSLSQFLPATQSAVTSYPISIALNLALNNGAIDFPKE